MPAPFPNDEVPAACGPTLADIHAVLDGDRSVAVLDADAHAADCAECRARVAEARVLLAALALPAAPVVVPARFTGNVLAAVRTDRRERRRRRLVASVGSGLAVAAVVVLAVLFVRDPGELQEVVKDTPPAPALEVAPAPRPVRVSAELAKAGDALRESSRPLADTAAAPKVLATIAEAMIPPATVPAKDDVVPAGASLADLPAAARVGLEPVTGTTQKAFNRLLRDVGVFSTAARPKS